jgi:hypothetical protein
MPQTFTKTFGGTPRKTESDWRLERLERMSSL